MQFKDFKGNDKYREYWDKCMSVFNDRDLLLCIIFCNDVFAIPPIKTFLYYFKDDFIRITGKANAELDDFVKKSIGAFWGMVFKNVLDYQEQKSVSVSMKDYFSIKTASFYSVPKDKITLEPRYGGY